MRFHAPVATGVDTVSLAEGADEAAATCVARLPCDLFNAECGRFQLPGRLAHPQIPKHDHRRAANELDEPRHEQ
jgi:hypothetical protein